MIEDDSTTATSHTERHRLSLPPPKKLLEIIRKSLDDDKAREVVVIDLAGKTSLADYMVIASGTSIRQMGAMAEHVRERVKASGIRPVPVEGLEHCDWVLIDAGDVIVHLFRPEVRVFYKLEKMWGADVPAPGPAPGRLVSLGRPLPPERLRAAEGKRLLAAVPKGAVVVALDAQGAALSSAALADRLGAWRDGGVKDVAFLIGGAEGLDPAVRQAAELVLSLGPMTWPHILVRALLAEQLYRAQTILAGHPYHRA